MSKKIKTSGSVWSGDDPNAFKKLAIQIDLENYKKTNDPSRLASIASYLDFYGLEEARDIFIDYFDKKRGARTNILMSYCGKICAIFTSK